MSLNWEDIFLNPVVLDCILSFLPLDVVKNLRSTCKRIDSVVTTSKFYNQKVSFTVCSSNVGNFLSFQRCQSLDILQTTDVKWKNLKIVLYCHPSLAQQTEKLQQLVKNHVKSLQISTKRRLENHRSLKLNTLFSEHWPSILESESITSFSVSYNLFATVSISPFKFLGKRTQKLEIYPLKYKPQEKQDILTGNIDLIADKCCKLTEFTFWNKQKSLSGDSHKQESIFRILNNNANTLKVINVMEGVISITDKKFESLVVPQLQKFKTYCKNDGQVRCVAKFLSVQRNVEEFELSCLNEIGADAIEHLMRSIVTLKKTLKTFVLDVHSLKNDVSLYSLEEMEVLQKLKLSMTLSKEIGFLRLPQSLKSLALHNIRLRHDVKSVIQTSSFLFENLTELTILKCKRPLNDDDLKQICISMPALHLLKIESASLTDHGVTGVLNDNDESGVESETCITKLTGLRALKLGNCSELSIGIIDALKFPLLSCLELSGNRSFKVTGECIVSLLSQNPNLEILSFSKCSLPTYTRDGFKQLKLLTLRKSNGKCLLAEDWNVKENMDVVVDHLLDDIDLSTEEEYSSTESSESTSGHDDLSADDDDEFFNNPIINGNFLDNNNEVDGENGPDNQLGQA